MGQPANLHVTCEPRSPIPDAIQEAIAAAKSAGQGLDSIFKQYTEAEGDWAKTTITQQKERVVESQAKRRCVRLGYARSECPDHVVV